MKTLLLIMAFFPGFLRAPVMSKVEGSKTMTLAVKESAVNILGSSNVNKFHFAVRELNVKDTLVVSENNQGQKLVFEKGLFRLPVKKFRNCNPMLVRDFKKLLDARNHPDILMNFHSLSALADEANQKLPGEAEVAITLSGKTINRLVQVQTTRSGGEIYLTGCERLRFSDFNLKPPTGVMGFIDVRNELDIDFRFVLKLVQ